jgi:peptidoglycan/LPS O-acetylase OafA/YrhL
MSDTLMAIIAAFAIIAAVLMAAFAYRLNENWASHCKNFADLLDEQNHFLARMNKDWYNAYIRLVEMKAEAKYDDE